ncbi:hypothetical protein THIOM_002606 [Candidatus Thiomargarita nelsonii]|uniref:Uncharacterized protein n=1 Tax=Candidatus Thiomargarita nelsonii TaxID=1003181 RepID=A0A176S0M4_9GAMM|nr:hypothetical protein THIOM_002606 [Candidatus Thiomargarita nelsonii]
MRKADGTVLIVKSVQLVPYERIELINLVVNPDSSLPIDHTYVTNGVLSGDRLLQDTNFEDNHNLHLVFDQVDLSTYTLLKGE